MKLKDIIEGMNILAMQGSAEREIVALTSDSRTVVAGSLFVALTGGAKDGHEFIRSAVDRGAAAVVCEGQIKELQGLRSPAVIVVRDSRDALAFMASRFYGSPAKQMTLIGITGTNGKTTTSYIVKKILEASGQKVGLIGTIKYMIGEREYAASFTTPEAVEYQRLLREMADEGCTFVVSEVSSHALALKRADYTRFVRAVFTNLTRDHLDYHGTMEQYLDAKKRLFTALLDPSGVAIVNADDPASVEILRDLRCRHMSYGIHSGSDVRASDIVQEPGGMSFRLAWRDKKYDIRTRLLGIPNVYNLLAAAATALSLEMPVEFVVKVLPDMAPIHGRFESIMSGDGVLFIVDYAHTPDALQKLLETVRGIPHRNIITVFGCGGNRDRGKRPLMGQIASEMSDFVVITSDNPRYEDPAAIIEDITEGIRGGNFVAVVERERGVREAVRRAGEGDVVVVAGKGHESYQDIGGVRYPMDDRQLIESALREAGRN